MVPCAVTVTPALALPALAALAAILADPPDTPVTGTNTELVPAANFTDAGTEATLLLLEERATVSADAVAADRLSVRSCVELAAIVRLAGVKLIVNGGVVPPVTVTGVLTVG